MPTLHLLPGESSGDTADIVLSPVALALLSKMLAEAAEHNYACGRFKQSDGNWYTVCVDVVDEGHRDWRDRPMAYLLHRIRHIRYDARKRPYRADLLGHDLYVARKKKRHSQKQVAELLGVSVGFISHVEHWHTTPREANFKKICAYAGTEMADYAIND